VKATGRARRALTDAIAGATAAERRALRPATRHEDEAAVALALQEVDAMLLLSSLLTVRF